MWWASSSDDYSLFYSEITQIIRKLVSRLRSTMKYRTVGARTNVDMSVKGVAYQLIKLTNDQSQRPMRYISKIRLFHLTYFEMPAQYAETFFDVRLRPAPIFGVSIRPAIELWPYIAIFTGRYYASAVYAVIVSVPPCVYLSVCLSVCHTSEPYKDG